MTDGAQPRWTTALAQARERLQHLPHAPQPLDERATRILEAVATVTEFTADKHYCGICGNTTDPDGGLFQPWIRSRAVEIREAVDAKRAGAVDPYADERHKLTEWIGNAEQTLTPLQSSLVDGRARLTETRAQLAQMGPAPTTPPDLLMAAVERAQRHHAELTAQAARAASAVQARATAHAMRSRADTLSRLVDAARGARMELAGYLRETAESRVQRYLPSGDRFGIELRDGDRDVFRWGLRDEAGQLRSALSGSELVRVRLAMALGLFADADRLVVLVPEERDWSAATLAKTMRAISSEAPDAYVVITSTTKPRGKTPKGWTIVQADQLPPEPAESTPVESAEGVEEAPEDESSVPDSLEVSDAQKTPSHVSAGDGTPNLDHLFS